MLTHFWGDSEINQMPLDGQIAKYTIPKGYVNATQMARANRKLLSDYMRLKSTREYLQALSNDMGIPISSLVVEIEGYGKEQGTWVHSEVAIDIARWVSVPFRIWANRTLTKVMLASEVEDKPYKEEEPPKALAPSQEAAQLALLVGEFAGLDKSLTAQLAVNAATRVNPALKPAADELKTAIACTDPSDDAFLNPTQIGEVIGKSAIAVNKWLVNAGLQYRTDDRKLPYRPTELGKQWGRMVSAVARGSNQTVFQLRWLPGVTELFQS
ncbi:KilA-N domain-containing protein [Komarekiella sp. 'clone 1']|uniref:KilA-N domain-containing protein n=1 Tax=Komarekiella delphini-convector SJRDD-AB1 TaxID=2593771 RepID=A0AA41BA15_9NOST|nr:KilA-N domain-containing protein [Komarekiella delphini-convector]MBD6620948.1 KilA-N domain-containing protein [Komarekiella delphini-convector SJRDD-AB1]